MNKNEKMDQIQEAMSLIEEAQTLIDEVVKGMSCASHYDAYGKYGFNQLLGNGNPYDGSLLKMYEELDEEEECEEFALYNSDDDVTLIIERSPDHGKWIEIDFKYNDEQTSGFDDEEIADKYRNFGGKTYMSYLSPEEVCGWIRKDYSGSWEVK